MIKRLIRDDYKINRNQQIYEEYINTTTSYNKLARKYSLSPQRIQFIVNDIKTKGLAETLDEKASGEERERYKNFAVELREQGKVTTAIKMLEDVVAWDKQHDNYRGLGNVYGELQNAYRKLAKQAKTKKEAFRHFEKIDKLIEEFLKLAREDKVPEGDKVIQMVHKSINSLHKVDLGILDKTEKNHVLKDALDTIDTCIVALPGSQAHKAWPLKVKAEILLHLKKTTEALETLRKAEEYLSLGYHNEVNWKEVRVNKASGLVGNNQAAIKLSVWTLQIHLTYARIYKELKQDILAVFHASAVISFPDPEGLMKGMKQSAKSLLEDL